MPANSGRQRWSRASSKVGGTPRSGVGVVVGHEQPTGAVLALGKDIELDHVDVVAQGRIEAGQGVAVLDVRGSLVPDAAWPAGRLTGGSALLEGLAHRFQLSQSGGQGEVAGLRLRRSG